MKKHFLSLVLCVVLLGSANAKVQAEAEHNAAQQQSPGHRISLSTTYYSFTNIGAEKTNTHHYELHVGYRLSPKDKIGLKLATWKMFAPMGIPMQEQLEFNESNFYPGRLRESGIGITYQRLLWKGLFVATEIMPQLKTYLDENDIKLNGGFKLYTSYHLGYHVSFLKDRIYLEPQIHCQYWPIDTNVPEAFEAEDERWNNYFLWEPNLYLGVNLNY